MKKEKFFFPLPYPGQSSPLPGHFDIEWPRAKKTGDALREATTKKAANEVARTLNQWMPLSDYTACYHPARTTEDSPALFWNTGKLSGQYALDRLADILLEALTINIVLPFGTIPLGHKEEEQKVLNEWAGRLWPGDFPNEAWRIQVGSGGFNHFGYETSEPGQLISFKPRAFKSCGLRICEPGAESSNFFWGGDLKKNEIGLALPKNLPLFCEKSPYQARAIAVTLRHLAEKIETLSSPTRQAHVEPHKMAVRCMVFAWWVKAGAPAERFESLAKHLLLDDGRGIKHESVREKLSPDLYLTLTSGVFSKGDPPEKTTAGILEHYLNIKG